MASPHPFETLLPGLQRLGAPDWVARGVRFTYYSAISITPHRSHYWYPDASGDWIDETGKRYGRADMPGAAGHGYTQVTIVGLDRDHAALDVQAYGFSRFDGPPAHLASVAEIGRPAIGSDYWIHPAVLRDIPENLGGRTKAIRMETTIDGKKYAAIRFQHESESGRNVFMYDLATGMLLHINHAAQGREGTTLTHMTFRGLRRLDLPWMEDPLPERFDSGTIFRYEGTQTQPLGGGRTFSRGMTAEASVKDRGATWARYELRIAEAMLPGMPPNEARIDRVAGQAMVGSLVLSPRSLSKLKPSQTLDRDPLTRYAVRVASVGADTVTITEAGEVHRFEYVYDRRTGVLLEWTSRDGRLFDRETKLTLKSHR
ncbi:MAG: hypothetical protein U0744_15065 [Gemmataceae bacterium]